MNANRDPEAILLAWLDEGPLDLPDVTRRAILTALPTTPQARRGLLAPWRSQHMNTFARGAAALVVAVVAIGALALLAGPGGRFGTPSPSPLPSTSASAPPLPALDATFNSPTYGYQIRYPTGWTVTPAAAPWPLGTNYGPGDPVTDNIVTPSGAARARISAASLVLPGGLTMYDFRSYASPYSSPFDGNPCPPDAPLPGPVVLDYEASPGATLKPVEAVVSINGCLALAELGGHVYDLQVIAGGRGYSFTLDGDLTPADALAWLATIRLEPTRAPTVSAAPSAPSSKETLGSP
jgi:hypothetical protein